MHAYTVTSKPSRLRRAARRVWACFCHLAAVALCLVLGLAVLAIRICRPVVELLARAAVRAEIEASIRTGMPPLASIAGRRLAEEMTKEFKAGWQDATTNNTTNSSTS
ncbi:hypothetical protein H3146_05975 [Streptomyces sp. OF3]|uniref:HAMP domain-containing protein n=1 Tax=Streptomyces alkaliterrae TaxID=2213162 RepID=A0A7W3WJB7_9ACTN|nr:hypothetical protein [Streptomyces alkaliterrae]MBB1252915.1 hypothetical protein [Streptomyces alkaliterrae]